jgi:hypothetical protein
MPVRGDGSCVAAARDVEEARESAATQDALAAVRDGVVVSNPVRGNPTQYPRCSCLVHQRGRSVELARLTINLREYRNE